MAGVSTTDSGKGATTEQPQADYTVDLTLTFTPGDVKERRLVSLLAATLPKSQWVGVRKAFGKERLLAMSKEVLNLGERAAGVVEGYGAKTVADVVGLSLSTLKADPYVHHSVLRGIIQRVMHFGFQLQP